MELLRGMYTAKVDDRNRVAIPARVWDTFHKIACSDDETASDEGLEVVVGLDINRKLAIFPKNVHLEFEKYLAGRPQYDPEWEEISTMICGSSDTQQLDKQHRVKIPSLLGEYFGLAGEIVILGAKDRLQLMSRKDWEASMAEMKTMLLANRPGRQG